MSALGRSIHVRGKGCVMADSLESYRLKSYPRFRLNFGQQGKRAKELLKAARAGDPEALARFKSPPKLAEAQYLIAQELRFDNWAALKRHIATMTREREAAQARLALTSDAPSLLDGELRTRTSAAAAISRSRCWTPAFAATSTNTTTRI